MREVKIIKTIDEWEEFQTYLSEFGYIYDRLNKKFWRQPNFRIMVKIESIEDLFTCKLEFLNKELV